jgi:hypothetical protein
MKDTQIIVAVFLALMFQQRWTSSAAEPTPVTEKQLLSTPAEFDGKHVSVIGYYTNSFERGSCLFTNRDAAEASAGNHRSIWIDETAFAPPPPQQGISELCELRNHYVWMVGIFRYRDVRSGRGFGLRGSWSSEITGIVNFRVARRTANDPINPCGMYTKK